MTLKLLFTSILVFYAEYGNANTDANTTEVKCGRDYTANAIHVGSNEATRFPWLAVLQFKENNANASLLNFTKGILIDDRHVLTIAGIFSHEEYSLENIMFGAHELGSKGVCESKDCSQEPLVMRVKQIIVHPEWNVTTHRNDIALLELENPITFNDMIQPICLPITKENYDGQSLFFGTFNEDENYSGKERKIKSVILLPVIKHEDCLQKLGGQDLDQDSQICAGAGGIDTCEGDGGGALVRGGQRGWEAVALASFGVLPCGLKPSVFTRIDHYLDWIQQVTSKPTL